MSHVSDEEMVATLANSGTKDARFAAINAAKALGLDPPPLDPTRIRIEVVSRSQGLVCAGRLLDVGTTVLDIYAADLRHFEKDTETATPEEMAIAQKQYELDVRDAEATRRKEEGAEYRKPYDPSFPAAFRALMRRDLKGLVSVRVLGDPAVLGPIEETERPKARVRSGDLGTGAFAPHVEAGAPKGKR